MSAFPSQQALEWVERWRMEHATATMILAQPMLAIRLEVVRQTVQSAIDGGLTFEEFAQLAKQTLGDCPHG